MIAAGANAVPAPRWPLIDLMRWPAIYAIVWLHTVRSEVLLHSTVLTRFGVPFFVAACVFLVFQGVWRKPQRTFVQYASNRFLRIYVPFLAWSAVYLAFKAVKSHFLPDLKNDYPTILEIFWRGSFPHLWFLPFIFVVSLIAFLVAKESHRHVSLRWPIAIGSLVAGEALCVPAAILSNYPAWALLIVDKVVDQIVEIGVGPGYPVSDYIVDALPCVFLAMTVALAYGHKQSQPWAVLSRLGLDVLVLAGSMICLWVFGRSALMENLAGTSLLLVALRPTDSALLCRVARFPALAYGIYFAHFLPIKVFESVAARRGFSPSWQLDCTIFLASALAATLLAWILYQFRWTRWLVA